MLECPAYADLRTQTVGTVHTGSWTDADVKGFMNKQTKTDWRNLAEYWVQCRNMRTHVDVGA